MSLRDSERICNPLFTTSTASTPESSKEDAAGTPPSTPLPEEVIEELEKAVSIRSLTVVNQLSAKLLQKPEHLAVAEQIREHARRYDFASLSNLVLNLRKENNGS